MHAGTEEVFVSLTDISQATQDYIVSTHLNVFGVPAQYLQIPKKQNCSIRFHFFVAVPKKARLRDKGVGNSKPLKATPKL